MERKLDGFWSPGHIPVVRENGQVLLLPCPDWHVNSATINQEVINKQLDDIGKSRRALLSEDFKQGL